MVDDVVCVDLVRFGHCNDFKASRHKRIFNNMFLDCESDDSFTNVSDLCFSRSQEN